MAKEKFDHINFKVATLAVIVTCNKVIADYRRQGYRLTLRQLYYQLIQADSLPDSWIDQRPGHTRTKNTLQNYKKLGDIITDARNAGLVDWDAIEDRGRNYQGAGGFDNPQDFFEYMPNWFGLDLRANQPKHIEAMAEKDAVSNILGPASRHLGIGFTANKGYSSASAMYEAGQRMADAAAAGQELVVLYFGDHDPSGNDMTRDVLDRLTKYSREEPIEVIRLALNMDQIEKYRPPENPAKTKDPRYEGYQREHGDKSWELDALQPSVLVSVLTDQVAELTDDDLLEDRKEEEKGQRELLTRVSEKWTDILEYLGED